LGVVTMGLVGYVVAVNQLETYVGANLLPWALLVGGAATCARTLADDAGSDRAAVPNPSRVSI
jgi:exopolysaccharide production protein ExoQ